MKNHDTLVIIRKVGDPRIVEIHDKVEMIKFVDGEWHVVLKDGVVHHYPSSSYVFDESDVKSLIIGRTGMKDIKVNVNGGKYDND